MSIVPGVETTTDTVDPVQRLALQQPSWQNLPLSDKLGILLEMKAILSRMSMPDMVRRLGHAEAQVMGLDPATPEGLAEASQAAFFYVLTVHGTISKLIEAYQYASKQSSKHPLQKPSLTKTGDQTIVQTSPLFWSDRTGPFALCRVEVWLKPGSTVRTLAVDDFVHKDTADSKDGCMVVLAAGNHCFLSVIDCLHGLFQCNRVVYLKHSPVRNHHDTLVRHLFQPLMDRGYLATELSTTVARAQEIVYHASVAHVHLTGGKTVHDAIVWKSAVPRTTTPVLHAKMTSELGCVTPWIVAPNQHWTPRQLRHQAHHLYAALYHNAGANCNSPKVLIVPNDWNHAATFLQLLTDELQQHDVPVSYYPGARERWMAFRTAYPNAREYGDVSAATHRPLVPVAKKEWLVPWLVIDVTVDLSTPKGRAAAQSEYAFTNEPFAPVLTIVTLADSTLSSAVTLANTYLFGSLSCTIVAPQSHTPDVQEAIAALQYGSIAVNCWSGCNYLALCGTWGAFPGETLDQVQSGIGQVHNVYFVRDIEKTVVRSRMWDPLLHVVSQRHGVTYQEYMILGDWILHPRLYSLLNMGWVKVTGWALPTPLVLLVGLVALVALMALVVVFVVVLG